MLPLALLAAKVDQLASATFFDRLLFANRTNFFDHIRFIHLKWRNVTRGTDPLLDFFLELFCIATSIPLIAANIEFQRLLVVLTSSHHVADLLIQLTRITKASGKFLLLFWQGSRTETLSLLACLKEGWVPIKSSPVFLKLLVKSSDLVQRVKTVVSTSK